MNRTAFRFGFSDLNLNVSHIEKVIGYEKGENQALVTGMIGEALLEAEKICEIKAEYVIWQGISFNNEEKSLQVNGIDFNIGKIVWSQLKKSESVAVFLCTAGEKISDLSRKYMYKKDFLKGYIYDIAGSEIVEAAADIMQEKLSVAVGNENKSVTNRFSPGYCGWNVSEQHKLFRLIPENFCGIKLTGSALMDPIKSVSGVIGIGHNVKFRPYTCNICDDKNCIYRKFKNA